MASRAKYILISAALLLAASAVGGGAVSVMAAPAEQKPAAKAKAAPKKAAAKGKQAPAKKRETSASVKKKEAAVNQEIKIARQQLDENERAVSENLALLEQIESDIAVQKNRIAGLEQQERTIISSIAEHERRIEEGQANLDELRRRYVAAVKKMRLARRKINPMAFIFSSKSFYQAWRRMRYMHKFSEWRERKEGEIKEQVSQLNASRQALSGSKLALENTLASQREAHAVLADKHTAQNQAVATLQAAGQALRTHLAKKQAEANDLNNRVSALIAAEQEEARQAELRRQEQARIAAERAAAEKARKEKEAAERAERQRIAAEKAAAEKAAAEKKAAADKAAKEKAAKQKTEQKKTESKKETKKPEPKKEEPKKEQPKSGDKSYAEARGRRPRTKTEGNTTGVTPKQETKPTAPKKEESKQPEPTKETPKAAPSAADGFAAAKGSLPRPVAGQFSIISRFGRHSVAGMKDVMYDNPGIDAVVAKGATAQAVYPGTVTGVYVLDGYSTVVIISHGEYYTVYGHIGTPMVKKGDRVTQGQALGHLVADAEEGGRTTIHFEVRKGREKLNPEAWIR